MSVDFVVSVRAPVALAAVIQSTSQTLGTLLAISRVPELTLVDGREYVRGVQTDPGHVLQDDALSATTIGEPIPPNSDDRDVGTRFFEMDVAGFSERTRVMLFDQRMAEWAEKDSLVRAVVSPARTCVGVVLAIGFGLATAIIGKGEIVDDEIGMLRPAIEDPVTFIKRTRLAEPREDFAHQCERFMRQFPHLNNWPPARRILPC
ncbi:hypothetical protein [Actinoallomurus rhizosphaericola]|uniref:hypothetical protein n=1 Tax=Actinoallomurus rhizosphaericola TaxID=2952536 RepID=UPI002090E721|nr:hypothetical protein [Actinoallomurus rhizosphaericola]MCO5992863.1 hypothetical protein [Actinoallomurus rhizosphaericola]